MLKQLGSNLDGFLKQSNTLPAECKELTRIPDLYFTRTASQSLCCIAAEYGWGHGNNSYQHKQKCVKHKLDFIDNLFDKPYDHERHKAAIAEHHPKYATVRDMMTKEQCARDNIQYYAPEQILEWADDLKPHTDNVILIPKSIEYLDLIPNDYVIGLSVPSSHGGDVLPVECYRGRRVHLLGGSWAKQLSYLYALGDDIVSLDNNWLALIASKRHYCEPSGQTKSINDLIPYNLENALHVAFTLSLASIQTALQRLLCNV